MQWSFTITDFWYFPAILAAVVYIYINYRKKHTCIFLRSSTLKWNYQWFLFCICIYIYIYINKFSNISIHIYVIFKTTWSIMLTPSFFCTIWGLSVLWMAYDHIYIHIYNSRNLSGFKRGGIFFRSNSYKSQT